MVKRNKYSRKRRNRSKRRNYSKRRVTRRKRKSRTKKRYKRGGSAAGAGAAGGGGSGGAGGGASMVSEHSEIKIHNFNTKLFLLYDEYCYAIIGIDDNELTIHQLMKINEENVKFVMNPDKNIEIFNDYFAKWTEVKDEGLYDQIFDSWMKGGQLGMVSNFTDLKLNGKRCGNFLVNSIKLVSTYQSLNDPIVKLVAHEGSTEGKLIKYYGSLGFKLTGKNMFGDNIEIPEEFNFQ